MKYIIALSVLLSSSFSSYEFDETTELANYGIANAQYNLGLMYKKGEGTPKNDAEAIKWFGRAAREGIAEAQYNLGYIHFHAEGVRENLIKSYAWLSMAKNGDHEYSESILELVELLMTKGQIVRAQEFLTRCYDSSYKDCENILSTF